ncbi:NUDIX domain-containing protein [Patescibacteria group bacterium]|nr:NUDIX domain-containing protein [Patescibacteria group bacterium]MBU1890444.1 NUDIX domain-containing protein [Patescibacteria group bacterium]
MRIVMTVCYLIKDGRILLGLKKIRLGKGLWNGPGGRVEVNETTQQAAVREHEAESGLMPLRPTRYGLLRVTKVWDEEVIELHIFRADEYRGDLRESDEMNCRWFPLREAPYVFQEIPLGQMWGSDWHFLPILLERRRFIGSVHFVTPQQIAQIQLEVVERLPECLPPED